VSLHLADSFGQLAQGLALGAVVAAGIAAYAGLVILAALLLSTPARLVANAFEHEYRDSVRNSPRGGYYVRLERDRQEAVR
jgi:hypothetical protein